MNEKLKGAIARGNVNEDGTVWKNGSVQKATGQTIEAMIHSVRLSNALANNTIQSAKNGKVNNPNASVEEVRAIVERDARYVSFDEIIKDYERTIAGNEQYIADLQLAGEVYRENTANLLAAVKQPTAKAIISQGLHWNKIVLQDVDNITSQTLHEALTALGMSLNYPVEKGEYFDAHKMDIHNLKEWLENYGLEVEIVEYQADDESGLATVINPHILGYLKNKGFEWDGDAYTPWFRRYTTAEGKGEYVERLTFFRVADKWEGSLSFKSKTEGESLGKTNSTDIISAYIWLQMAIERDMAERNDENTETAV